MGRARTQRSLAPKRSAFGQLNCRVSLACQRGTALRLERRIREVAPGYSSRLGVRSAELTVVAPSVFGDGRAFATLVSRLYLGNIRVPRDVAIPPVISIGELLMKRSIVHALLVSLAVSASVGEPASAQSIVLDNFEEGLRVENPTETDPQTKYLWNQYSGDFYAGPDPGVATVTTSQAHDGTHGLQVNVTGGNIYLQFYPATSTWNFMHQYVQPASSWTAGKYNAIRFWVKVPPQMIKAGAGHENVQIGTYVRAENGDPGTQGTHYYHFYNFKYTGEWEQVIFDSHPTYLLGGGGNTEPGNIAFPFGGNWTYTDALTRFYFDGQNNLSSVPATFYFDGYELFTRPANENIDQVYAMHSVYVPATNEIAVGWSRRKDQDSLTYEVRYAYQDINSIGWSAATPAPNGTIAGNGLGAYNVMEYSTKSIDVSNKSTVYIAIKPTTATAFRQISVEISNLPSSSPPPVQVLPEPPTNVTVQ